MTAGMDDVLKQRLQGPARLDLGLVAELDRHFVGPDRLGDAREGDQVAVQRAGPIGHPGIDEGRTELVVGAGGEHAGEDDAAVHEEVDQVAVGWGS